jgi:hypothetical protein
LGWDNPITAVGLPSLIAVNCEECQRQLEMQRQSDVSLVAYMLEGERRKIHGSKCHGLGPGGSMAWHLTKYALTSGITEAPDNQIEKKGAHVYWSPRGSYMQMFRADVDAYNSADEAYAAAIAMARKKIEANRKSTEKMEALIKEWENKC